MITCRELTDFLADYLDGELPESQRAAFEEHLAACPPCVRYIEQYKQTIKLGKLAVDCEDKDQTPPQVPERLLKAILAARKR